MLNIGNSIGPVVGSILYSFVGYFYMFMIVGCLFLIIFPFLKFTMPPGIDENENTDDLVKNESLSTEEDSQEISYFKILCDPVILLAMISQVLFSISFSFFEPVLSFRLLEFNASVHLQGLVF